MIEKSMYYKDFSMMMVACMAGILEYWDSYGFWLIFVVSTLQRAGPKFSHFNWRVHELELILLQESKKLNSVLSEVAHFVRFKTGD